MVQHRGKDEKSEQRWYNIEVKMVQTRGAKVLQNPRQNSPKCTHVGSKKTRPRGVPHRLLGVIFEVFEVLGGIGLPSASWEVFWAALG